jgi:citronellol/citronellal dehydrogenase
VVGDVRKEEDVQRAVDAAVERFGGIDICINNASAIATEGTEELSAKKYDLMQDINCRGTFLLTKACLPHLRKSANAHILTIAPPINMNPFWLGRHPSYTLSKYGMTLLALGWANEFGEAGIASSCLRPQTYIATAAVTSLAEGSTLAESSRSPEIMADAAVEIFSRTAERGHRTVLHRCRSADGIRCHRSVPLRRRRTADPRPVPRRGSIGPAGATAENAALQFGER